MNAISRIATGVARGLLLERQAEFWLGQVAPTRSLAQLRARVEEVVDETADVKTFRLRPNGRWSGHQAGQFTTVELEIDGVRTRRCYSISSAPGRLPAITVKRKPGGVVSGWMHAHLRRGDVIGLGLAAGDFVLPAVLPQKLLFLTGGSGITPAMSMLLDLGRRAPAADIVLVHHARSADDVIFRGALAALAARAGGPRVVLCSDDGSSGLGPFDEARLALLVPDFARRESWVCGPPGLMERVQSMWEAAGIAGSLRQERFTLAPPRAVTGGKTTRIRLAHAGRSFVAGPGTLLEQLEQAGAKPVSGCRMGICRTCKVRKVSGAVEDLRTGAVSGAADEDVQPCISVARSDLELSL